MRRLIISATVAAVTATAVTALTLGARGSGPVEASEAGSSLRLDADPRPTPSSGRDLMPGGTFHYSFTVTNKGSRPVRSLVARSEKVLNNGRAGDGLDIVRTDPAACRAADRVICRFDLIEPGEKQRVEVFARTSHARKPGDKLTIHTYLAAFSPEVQGSITYDVLGELRVTETTFAAA